MVYFEKKSMDVERREGAMRASEMGGAGTGSAPLPERAQKAPREAVDTAVGIDARRKAALNAARASREMKDPLLVRIEAALSDGLATEYAKLSVEKKAAFKAEGEKLSAWLHEAAASGRIKPHEVLAHLERWLLIIEAKDRSSPWLLQEAYVRARRMVKELMYNSMGH
jgi:hypothetical protein